MLFRELGVPRSTAVSWIRRGQRPVVSAQVLALDQLELQTEVLALGRRIKLLLAKHLPDGASKRSILDAVAHATKAIPLAVALRVLRLSSARYHDWSKRPPACSLDERSSCPHSSPTQVTAKEASDMRDMVVSQDYRHMSILSLALGAQRTGKIFLSPSTWARLIRERGWLRPRHGSIRPNPRKVFVRPNQLGAFSGKGDVCLASERSIEWRASGISETSNPRPKAFSASRFDVELRTQMSPLSVGECRWTTTPPLARKRPH
jgi:hypothetical protein